MTSIRSCLLIAGLAWAGSASALYVPAASDPWLAGMPDGSTASGGDTAPAQSPVAVAVAAGWTISFSVTGEASNCNCSFEFPDGGSLTTHSAGAENGFSDINAPINSLIGVFIGPTPPNGVTPPAALDFSAAGLGTDFTSLSPALNQVFFVGDGRTSAAQVQTFTAPAGATRLFLGTMDGYEWQNNIGGFGVTVAVPEAGTAATTLLGLGTLALVAGLRRGGRRG